MSRKQTRVSAKVDLSTVDGIFDALSQGKIGREQAQQAHAALAKQPALDATPVCTPKVADNGTALVEFALPDENGRIHPRSPQATKGLRFWRAVLKNAARIEAACVEAQALADAKKTAVR